MGKNNKMAKTRSSAPSSSSSTKKSDAKNAKTDEKTVATSVMKNKKTKMAGKSKKSARKSEEEELKDQEDGCVGEGVDVGEEVSVSDLVKDFRVSLGFPSWKHAKCRVCNVKIGEAAICFTFEDIARLSVKEAALQRARQEERKKSVAAAKTALEKKRQLKASNPEEYERRYKRFHYQGCPCCEAMGISLPEDEWGDADYHCSYSDEEEEEEYDSLSEEAAQIESGMIPSDFGNLDYLDRQQEDGRLRGQHTYALHPTARCLGSWRRANWWEGYRARLPTSAALLKDVPAQAPAAPQRGRKRARGPAPILEIKPAMTESEKKEFQLVWDAIESGNGDPSKVASSLCITASAASASAAVTASALTGAGADGSAQSSSSSSSSGINRSVLSNSNWQKMQQHVEKVRGKNKPELLRMLKHNGIVGVQTCAKAHIVDLVAVNQTLGVLKHCPKCRRGQLDFDWATGKVTCRGYKRGMTGWVHCAGPTFAAGETWRDLERTAWKDGLAAPPETREAARARKAANPYRPAYSSSFFYDDYDPFGDPFEPFGFF
ncbi:unnamed protein product [Amoebophrya sp. A25]|nr:unnamed protein product [Amoebophrya sp. A25]|eukprot:GSA25T00020293001.1